MAKSTKPAAVVHAVALSPALELIAHQIAGALQETSSLSETLGELTRDAGKIIAKKPDMLDPFVDGCKQMCASVGLTEGSFKVYMSNIRGVLRAMIAGYAPKAGATLRQMYDDAPKGTGRQKATGARHATDKPSTDGLEVGEVEQLEGKPVAPSKAEARKAAIATLFGHADDELAAAMEWAAAHELRFLNIIKAQIEFDAKPVALKKAA